MTRLFPDLFGLCLNASYAIQNADCTIQNSNRSADFEGKVGMPWGIDQIDGVTQSRQRLFPSLDRLHQVRWVVVLIPLLWWPPKCDGGRLNGNSSCTFRWQKVRHCRSIVDITDPAGEATVEQHAFRGSGLARIDMSDDADVPCSRNF